MVAEQKHISKTMGRNMDALLWVGLAGGCACFAWALLSGQSQRAWQAYLVNLVFWLGVCSGSVTLVAVMNMTNAAWGRSLKRLAEAGAVALPLLWLLLLGLYWGHQELYLWAREPVHGKELWLSTGFFFARDASALGAIAAVGIALVYASVRGDLELMAGSRKRPGALWRLQARLSPVLGILYGVGMSVLAWDLIMSLDPHWVSTLFGAYYFMGSLYTAIAWVSLLSAMLCAREEFQGRITPAQFHDLGKLLLAFCLLTGDFFYSQFLVIWYGNIPEETRYVILRVRTAPWNTLAWGVLVGGFGIPFAALLSRRLKQKPGMLGALALLILVAMWFERVLLVAPSTSSPEGFVLGFAELGTAMGFLCLVGLLINRFLSKVPWLPVGDPLFRAASAPLSALGNQGPVVGAGANHG